MARRTPQEKKRLSLEKDRRNAYGESPHGARKAIPFRKKLRNRANRHQQESALPSAPAPLAEVEAAEIETSIKRKAPKKWRKVPDAALANIIAGKQQRRVQSYGRKIRDKTLRAFRDGQFCGKCRTCLNDVYILAGRHGREHYGAFCAVGQGLPNPTFSKVKIHPCPSSELPEVARELYSVCVQSEDPHLGDWLCRLFGHCKCPHCGTLLNVAEVVDAYEGIRSVCSASGLKATHSPRDWRPRLSDWLYSQP
jgi:hypothetical protein